LRNTRHGVKRIDLTEMQLASSETARMINRDIVLELVRTGQPISRADLARRSGLGRSTVSQIVEQLIGENWVREGAMGSLPRGRRPTMVGLNEDLLAIAIDIHPKEAGVALVDLNGRLQRWPVTITSDPETSIRRIVDCIKRICSAQHKSPQGIGISLPGRIDPTTQRLIFAPNLNWPEFDIKKMVETEMGLPVMMDNDATACLMAELTFSRMEGVRDAVLVAIGEGVGTCVLANGQFLYGHNGMAGEFGHILVDPNGPPCACGQNGCWEVFSSCQAALRYYRELGPQRVIGFQELLHRADQGDSATAQGPRNAGHVDRSRIADDYRQRFAQHHSDRGRPHGGVAPIRAGDREGGGQPHVGRQPSSNPPQPRRRNRSPPRRRCARVSERRTPRHLDLYTVERSQAILSLNVIPLLNMSSLF